MVEQQRSSDGLNTFDYRRFSITKSRGLGKIGYQLEGGIAIRSELSMRANGQIVVLVTPKV